MPLDRRKGWSDHPAVPALLSLLAGVVVVLGRLAWAADGEVDRFVLVGSEQRPERIDALAGDGYDGQFAYRLALDPSAFADAHVGGIGFDRATRPGRIGYPALAWLGAGGQPGLVPWSLVGVNLAGLGALGWFAGRFAQTCRRHAVAGLLVSGWAGLLMVVARDLSEVVAATAVVGGLLTLRQRRPGLAALALSLAVLAREPAIVVPLALAFWRLWEVTVRRRSSPSRLDAAWVVPLAALVGWQVVVLAGTSEVPAFHSVDDHLVAPTVGTLAGEGWLRVANPYDAVLKLAQLGLLVTLVALATLTVWRRRSPRPWEAGAWLLGVAIAVRVSPLVWNDWAHFRAFTEVYVLSMLVVFTGRTRLLPIGVGAGLVWVLTAGHVSVVL